MNRAYIRNIVVIVSGVILFSAAFASAGSYINEAKIDRAVALAHQAQGIVDERDKRNDIYEKHKSLTQELKEKEENLRHCRDKHSYATNECKHTHDYTNRLTGQIDQLQKNKGFFDVKAYFQIRGYEKEKQKMSAIIDRLENDKKKFKAEEPGLIAEVNKTKSELKTVEDQIRRDYGSTVKLRDSIEVYDTELTNLRASCQDIVKTMSEEEKSLYTKKIWKDYNEAKKKAKEEEAGRGADKKAETKPPHVLASNVGTGKPKEKPKEKPDEKGAPEEEAALPEGQAEDQSAPKHVSQSGVSTTTQPEGPGDLAAGDYEIIDMSCGTELMQSPDGKAIYTKLRSINSASVTIVKDGKVYDITGEEATKLLVRSGYFVHETNVGLVASKKYLKFAGEDESTSAKEEASVGGSSDDSGWASGQTGWMDNVMETTELDPEASKAMSQGVIGKGEQTPAWRKREHTIPMSAEDAKTYGGGLLGGGNE